MTIVDVALRALNGGLLVLAASPSFAAQAQFPLRPVRMVVPFAPGGGLDLLARTLAPRLLASTGQTWVVDNRSGAAGNLGAEIVARASADGYTLLLALNTQLTANPSLYKLAFDAQKDFQPVTLLGTTEHVLVVHPSVPAKSFKDFLALARQKPGALSYASAGVGSAIHMAAELLKQRAGIDLLHVAYKGGGPAAAAVLAGETQVIVGTGASVIQFINAGRLRALATTGPKRSKLLPDQPTIAELGYPGFDTSQWYGALLPASTPRNVVDRVHTELVKAMHHPEVQPALASQGVELETNTPEQFAARIKAETATWAAVIKQAGIRAE